MVTLAKCREFGKPRSTDRPLLLPRIHANLSWGLSPRPDDKRGHSRGRRGAVVSCGAEEFGKTISLVPPLLARDGAARRADHGPRRALIALTLFAGLTCCAERPETGVLVPVSSQAAGSLEHRILVASTRARDPRPGTYFNGERTTGLDHASLTVAVPPDHKAGEIEWPQAQPGDPATDFVVRWAEYIDSDRDFIRAVNAELAKRPAADRNVFLFVHGYNTLFAEALYRFAQMVHDAKWPGVPVLFAWASRGRLTQYIYDNNSATIARDELEHTLRLLFQSDARKVSILAHSMGNWVTVEALRQLKMSGGLPGVDRIGDVILAAPDLDIDVFKAQMRRFGRPRKPFYVILSRDDRALEVSDFIAGGRPRLGAYADDAELAALGAIVVDLTEFKSDDPINHSKFAEIAAAAPRLLEVLRRGIGTRRAGNLNDAGEAVGATLTRVVEVPATILGPGIRILTGR